MIGNVWEWVDETVEDGKLGGVELPKQGYITEMNDEGIVLKTSPQPDPSHFNDYLWVETSETRGVIRGGFWGVAQKGGQYAANVTVPPSFAGNGVGFRCVQ
jgi:formylglycine-generating enzyme required for sulfatase activity